MLRYAILMLLIVPALARADAAYRYAFAQPQYWVAPGGLVIAPVYLEETVEAGTPSRLVTEHGLASASVLVETTSPAGPVAITQIVVNPLFDDLVSSKALPAVFPADSGSVYGQMLDPLLGSMRTGGLDAQADPVDPDTRRVLLGNFHFTATGLPGESATFQASQLNDVSDAWTWDALYNSVLTAPLEPLDADDLTITIIPEPSILTLLLLPAMSLLRRRP